MSVTVEKCLQAWTNSLKQMNVKADVVFLGDSLTYYGDFSSVFPEEIVCNLGLRGDTIQGMRLRISQLILLEPQKVFLMAGINDVSVLDNYQFKIEYEQLIKTIKKALPSSILICQSMLPVNSEEYIISCTNQQIIEKNKIIRHLSNYYGLAYIDLFTVYLNKTKYLYEYTYDGIHLKSESYQKWYNEIRKFYHLN